MMREYLAVLLAAAICVLMSTEASGQPTVDEGACVTGLARSEQLAHVAQKVDKVFDTVLALNQRQNAFTTTPVDPLKHALVSALECEYRFHAISSCMCLKIGTRYPCSRRVFKAREPRP